MSQDVSSFNKKNEKKKVNPQMFESYMDLSSVVGTIEKISRSENCDPHHDHPFLHPAAA